MIQEYFCLLRQNVKNNNTSNKIQAYLILLHFALLCFTDVAFFLQIQSLWQLCIKQVISAIFPPALAHFLSLCHVLVILTIFQTFPLLLYFLWLSMISDL